MQNYCGFICNKRKYYHSEIVIIFIIMNEKGQWGIRLILDQPLDVMMRHRLQLDVVKADI